MSEKCRDPCHSHQAGNMPLESPADLLVHEAECTRPASQPQETGEQAGEEAGEEPSKIKARAKQRQSKSKARVPHPSARVLHPSTTECTHLGEPLASCDATH